MKVKLPEKEPSDSSEETGKKEQIQIEMKPGYVRTWLSALEGNLIPYESIYAKSKQINILPESETEPYLTYTGHSLGLKNRIVLSDLRSAYPNLSTKELDEFAENRKELDSKKAALEARIDELTKSLETLKGDNEKIASMQAELNEQIATLKRTHDLKHVIDRVNGEAGLRLLKDPDFFTLFESNRNPDAVILSIDIRRSTELMLKALVPEDFSKFIHAVTVRLKQIVLANYGIYDKFTGDGILAFFPTFYSGEDSIAYALRAAEQAHQAFHHIYSQFHHIFVTVMADAGIGIGIDFGQVYMMLLGSDITVVGRPVVYACRLAGCKAGQTLLNQGAMNRLRAKYENSVTETKTEFLIKNEGPIWAYEARMIPQERELMKPPWLAQ